MNQYEYNPIFINIAVMMIVVPVVSILAILLIRRRRKVTRDERIANNKH